MLSLFSSMELSAMDAARLRRIERNLELIMKHLGIADPSQVAIDLPHEVRLLASEGRKIEAIKSHRKLCGSDLRQAKEAVEASLAR
jgi:ribosomal protein L7/L12